MSDYIYSSQAQQTGLLTKHIQAIYQVSPPDCQEFYGDWGCLAVSQSHYCGFMPFENESHILVVIGAPVFYFRDNDFLTQNDSNDATQSIYHRWIVENKMQWDEDLSGPFTVLLIDKKDVSLQVVTDLMGFIPVYKYQENNQLYLATHIDALATTCGHEDDFDQASLVDFILNDVITYPYTAYKNTWQLPPGSIVSLTPTTETAAHYWQPTEENSFTDINHAAKTLREGIEGYVNRVTVKMDEVAQFISAGEDSRSLSGLLPKKLKRDAFIFLDNMNREGRIAKKVAEIYGANFYAGYRKETHYLDILEEGSKLVGTGHQYTHAHSLGFDKQFGLKKYSAVFGGYLSDSLLKAAYVRKIRGQGRLPFLPDIALSTETRTKPLKNEVFNQETLAAVNVRRLERFQQMLKLRPKTAHEWFVLYPTTMRTTIPNFYSTRRLFKSYEPFMSKEVVKISASVPIEWKLNRRLFNRAMKPYLKPSKWLLHADGRLPYFNWWVNMPIQFVIWFYRQIAKKIGLIKGNQGPWGDWNNVIRNQAWLSKFEEHKNAYKIVGLNPDDKNNLNRTQQINLLQVMQKLVRK